MTLRLAPGPVDDQNRWACCVHCRNVCGDPSCGCGCDCPDCRRGWHDQPCPDCQKDAP